VRYRYVRAVDSKMMIRGEAMRRLLFWFRNYRCSETCDACNVSCQGEDEERGEQTLRRNIKTWGHEAEAAGREAGVVVRNVFTK